MHFRWSISPRSQLYTRLETGRDYRVRIRFVYALSPNVLNSLRMEVNGQPIALERTDDTSAPFVFTGRIPREVVARDERLTTLIFKSDLQVVAGTTISLGLAFSDLSIEAVD